MPELAPRRWLYLFLVLASTVAAGTEMAGVFQVDGFSTREIVILALFTILFAWIASSFWLTVFGAFARFTKVELLPLKPGAGPSAARTVILMPIYNEDVARVFAGVRAVLESAGPDFDFFILSDSTNPANWVAEELAWQKLKQELGPDAPVFYRHRPRNVGRKSGNIQDFCENWGQLYDYMVILDADSLMTGKTLSHLVGLMDANPRAGLIQVPAQLVGRNSLFARIQQYGSSVYGPLYTAGLAFLQGPDGNYWGHNAIIRVHAFMQHCGLPRLSGLPPFGGEIMSHDFVEAALLRRAGWDVWMAPDIGGSYEEPPPTLMDYLIRDRRWCQGNLQHLRVIFAQGLTLPSRMHMAMGVMSYLSSPLWLLLLVVSGAEMMNQPPPPSDGLAGFPPAIPAVSPAAELGILVLATLVLLFGPKILATAAVLKDAALTRAHGGTRALVMGLIWEALFSTLVAPIMMLQHSWYVLSLAMGMSTGWNSQTRTDRALPLGPVARKFAPHTLIGAIAAFALWNYAPDSFDWFVPLLGGLILSVPLVVLSSSPLLGEVAREDHLFLVPSESRGLRVLDRAHQLAGGQEETFSGQAQLLVLDDARVRGLHLALLKDAAPPAVDPLLLWSLRERIRRHETASFSRDDWTLLLSDSETLRALP